MGKAFSYVDGQTYLVHRRIKERFWFLRPDPLVTAVVLFAMAEASRLSGVAVHAACVCCDGMRLAVTDPGQGLPVFMWWLDKEIAHGLKAIYGIQENVWAPGSYQKKPISTPCEVLSAVLELLSDPVRLGLVDRNRRWAGVRLGPWSAPQEVPRPGLVRLAGREEAERLEVAVPPAFRWMNRANYVSLVNEGVRQQEEEDRETRLRRGLPVLGLTQVLASAVWTQTAGADVARNPVAALDPRTDARASAALRRWRREYEVARRIFALGLHAVEFPHGTYWLKRFAGAHVAPRPC